MKEQLIQNIDSIIQELEKGNDIQIKTTPKGIKIQSIKIKSI